jgi:hypothetical protein
MEPKAAFTDFLPSFIPFLTMSVKKEGSAIMYTVIMTTGKYIIETLCFCRDSGML